MLCVNREQSGFRRVSVAAIGAVVLLSTSLAVALDVPMHTRPFNAQDAGVVQFETATDRVRLSAQPFSASIDLGAFDTTRFEAEDEGNTGGKIRLGASRQADITAADGAWQHVAGEGWLWSSRVISPAAYGLRLHFDALNLPDGAEIFVRDGTGVDQVFGPITGDGDFDTAEQWTSDIFGDEALVEYFVPTDSTVKPALPFVIDQVMHVYNEEFLGLLGIEREGPCHNDVTCYAPWQTLAQAVARITMVENGFLFLCSGALINTEISDETPYFMTAAHCIETQTVANTLTCYWFYQSSVCNGAPPSLGSRPTSSAANLIATADDVVGPPQYTNDISLLTIRGVIPPGVSWMGWTTDFIGIGIPITNIHHPDGAYKRISFGVSGFHAFGDNFDYMGLTFNSGTGGTIEGGSSGSPMFRDSDQNFISVCSHGPVGQSCFNSPEGPFGYGRFSRFYDGVAGVPEALAAGGDDEHEPNASCATATPDIGDGSFGSQVVKSTDEDWLAFDLEGCERLTVQVTFTNAWGNIDMELYDSCGGSIVDSSTTTNFNQESVTVDNIGAPATYYVRIYLSNDTRNGYTLNVTKTSLGTGPSITDHPDSQTVDEGDPVSFMVMASGDPTLLYQWKKDGGDLGSETNDTLNIASAAPGDAGDYTCVVTNGCGSVESNIATLTVNSGIDGDFDGDGDVDLSDFAQFSLCFGGPNVPPAGSCPPGVDADFDNDGDVDLSDFATFSLNFTGPL